MKKLLSIVTLGAVALALPTSGFAAEKKVKAPDAAAPAPTEGAKKPAEAKAAPEAKPAAEAKAGGEAKAMGMYVKVDAIDAAGKTFTHKNKDGKEVKFVVTDKTEIKNGDAAAKLADIKVGDTVSGSRMKKSETEYEVVKITKFGVAAPKEKKPEGEKKPDAPKKPEEKKS
jgi:hypothetical protein